jgi:hypothetical protein
LHFQAKAAIRMELLSKYRAAGINSRDLAATLTHQSAVYAKIYMIVY